MLPGKPETCSSNDRVLMDNSIYKIPNISVYKFCKLSMVYYSYTFLWGNKDKPVEDDKLY